MKKIGVVGVPDGWSSESLADEVEKLTGFRLLIDLEHVFYNSEMNTIMFKDTNLMDLDGLIIKKVGPRYSHDLLNRLELLLFLEKRGIKFFSPVKSILKSFNRLSGTLHLQLENMPMPKTVITEDIDLAVNTVKDFNAAIFKPLFSTKARGMVVLSHDDPDLKEKVFDFKNSGNTTMYIQQMVKIPGKDLGIAFLGGEYVATYARVANSNSWNTTINSGGKYEPYEPPDDIIELARKAQSIFNLDFTSVDVVETDEGPVIFEVSAFGGFRGLLKAQKLNAAQLYAEYVVKRV